MKARALPTLDVLDVEEDGERVLLLEGRAVVLSPVASVVHELLASADGADGWRTVAELLAQLADLVPLPPEPEAALAALLADLAAQDVLQVTSSE